MRAALLAVALSLPARGLAAPPGAPPALLAAAEELADAVGAPAEGRRALRLAVEPRAGALAQPVETALAAALAARGWIVTPHRGEGEPEATARAAQQDLLLRVRAGLLAGRRELALVGELIPTWASFFLQRHPGARAVPPRVVQSRTSADAATLLLAREARPHGAPFASVRRLARLPGRVLALSLGEPGERGSPAVVAVTPGAVLVLAPDGATIATLDSDPSRLRPVRDPAATVAVGDFGGGRIALRRAGAPQAEVLALRGEQLEPAGEIDGAPLCAGAAGPLFGELLPGTGVLADLLSPLVDPGAAPRSARTLYGVAAAPGGGPIAFAVLGTDLRLDLLGPDLAPLRDAVRPQGSSAAEPPTTGTGFALADLDGDGIAELVASSPDPGAPDRIRILAPLAEPSLLFASGPIAGEILAGAGGDLTGDGVDDAVLAAVGREDGAVATDLLLVTADARELR